MLTLLRLHHARGKTTDQYDDMYFIEGNIFNVQKEAISYFKDRLSTATQS